jgi:hypothetical protein
MYTRRDLVKAGAAVVGSAILLRPTAVHAAAAIKSFKPGEYLWLPELAPDGPTVVLISLSEQLVHVYRNGIEIGVSTCSTGTKNKKTPTGVFTILQKRETHFSSIYDNAPMPNMQRLTWQGIALHAGHLPGYPASHGCIRLPMEFSKLLFATTQLGTTVIISDQPTQPTNLLTPGIILPPEAASAAAANAAKGKTDKSGWTTTVTSAVASILVSAGDRKAYLMIDGALSGSMPIRIKEPERPLGTHLYRLIGPSPDGRSLKWMAFGFRGAPRAGETVDRWNDDTLGRIEWQDYAKAVETARTLKDGTTMVVTDYAAGPETRSAPDFTVMVEDKTVNGKRRNG